MKRLLPLLALGLAGCGGSSPTAPSSPPPIQPVQVHAFDGWTGQPVAAAVSPSDPMPGATVTAMAGGYLPRVQTAAPQLFLWPGDEAYVRALVYGQLTQTHPLLRWTASGFTLTVPPEAADVAAVADEVSQTTGLRVGLGPGGEVSVAVDPTDPVFAGTTYGAATYLTVSGDVITSARIVYRRQSGLDGPGRLLHEVGHAVGLEHSTDADDVMHAIFHPEATSYTPRERVALRLMYRHRAPGNAAPDTEPGTRAAGGSRTLVVVD
jgi:matrixin